MKKFLIVLFLSLTLIGCSKKDNLNPLDEVINKNNYVIIDVRTQDEYYSGHIKDAINIPYDQIESLDVSKDKDILVYCASGKRSSIAYNKLVSLGYNVYDLGAFNQIDLEKE